MEQVGRYRILEEVARGGSGSVHRAVAPDGREVALKLLLAGAGASAHQRRRVDTEIQALLRLRHPNVVTLLDAGKHRREADPPGEGTPWLAMEWVAGETLAARLDREGPLDPRAAAEMVRRLAKALAHCHAQGILHRDLKPENVLLRAADGQPLLTDFGLSQDVSEDGRVSRTHVGLWLGTPGYWPPEQARGDREAIGPRSDVYGLGALLYAALTGVPPQDGATLQEQLRALEQPPPAPGQRRPGVPPWLDAVCVRALARDPAGRQASAEALAEELAAGLTGRAAPRTRWRGAALPGACLLLVALGAGAWALLRRPAPVAAAPAPAAAPETHSVVDATRARDEALERAQACAAAGDLPAAEAACAHALELDPRHVQAWVARGQLREHQGRLEEALTDLDRALELDPRQAAAYLIRGNQRCKLGRFAEGIEDFDLALALDPGNALVWVNRGQARAALGQLEEAIDDFQHAVGLIPRSPVPWFDTGVAHERQGLLQEAFQDYSRALDLDPTHIPARVNRAVLYGNQGRWQEVVDELDQALEIEPRLPRAWEHRGRAHAMLNQGEQALADYDRALALEPGNATLLVLRGSAALALQRFEDALADLDAALRLAPEDPAALANRGVAHEALGHVDLALEDYEHALRVGLEPTAAGEVRARCERLRAAAQR